VLSLFSIPVPTVRLREFHLDRVELNDQGYLHRRIVRTVKEMHQICEVRSQRVFQEYNLTRVEVNYRSRRF
jgi:hypothetical protein